MATTNRVTVTIKKMLYNLRYFIYNSETKEVLGRSAVSWGQIGVFYFFFFALTASFFFVQLAVFVGITPSPGPNIAPWNFGRYAYPNYPNAKLELISLPETVLANSSHITFSSDNKKNMDSLLNSASSSGVGCLNTTDYGFTNGKSCILIRVTKVFEWTPSLIADFLDDILVSPIDMNNYMNISCIVENEHSDKNISITLDPPGIPLNIPNNDDGKSYPFLNQNDYKIPLTSVIIDISNASLPSDESFEVKITCGLDLEGLGINEWSNNKLSSIYEIPSDVTINMNIKSGNL